MKINVPASDMIVAFFKAAAEGNVEAVKIAVEGYPQMGIVRTKTGMSALMVAATYGQEDCVKALIPHSKVEAKDQSDHCALEMAARHGHVSCVRALVPVVSGESLRMPFKIRSLEMAAGCGHLECVQELIPVQMSAARRAFALAAEAGHTDCAAFIGRTIAIKQSATTKNILSDVVELAAIGFENGDMQLGQRMLALISPRMVNTAGQNALMLACQIGSLPCVQALAPFSDPRTDVNKSTALSLAAASGHEACMDVLLPSASTRVIASAFVAASQKAQWGCADKLLQQLPLKAVVRLRNAQFPLREENRAQTMALLESREFALSFTSRLMRNRQGAAASNDAVQSPEDAASNRVSRRL